MVREVEVSKLIQNHHYGRNDRFMAALVIILDRFDVRQARPRNDFQNAYKKEIVLAAELERKRKEKKCHLFGRIIPPG